MPFNTSIIIYIMYICKGKKKKNKKKGGAGKKESGKRRRLMTVLSDKEVRKRKHGEKERGLWFHGLWWVCVLFLKN